MSTFNAQQLTAMKAKRQANLGKTLKTPVKLFDTGVGGTYHGR